MKHRSLLLLLLAACAGDPQEGAQVDPNAIPEIIAFSAQASVRPNESATITYEVKNARTIDIVVGDRTVLSTFEGRGSVDSGGLRRDTKVTLTARNGVHVASAELTISVRWEPPVIDDFSVIRDPVLVEQGAQVRWSTANVEIVRILRGGIEVFLSPEAISGTLLDVAEGTNVFVLEASNPGGTATRELSVEATHPPQVLRFALQPRVYFGRPLHATLSWEVRYTTEMRLDLRSASSQSDRLDLLGGALQTIGSIPVDIMETGYFSLGVNSIYGGGSANQYVWNATPETEPNDTLDALVPISSGAIASLENAADVDVFAMSLESYLSGLRFYLAGPDGTGCPLDATITLHTMTEPAFATGGAGCTPLELSADEVQAIAVRNATIFIEVSSDSGATGPYGLLTEEL